MKFAHLILLAAALLLVGCPSKKEEAPAEAPASFETRGLKSAEEAEVADEVADEVAGEVEAETGAQDGDVVGGKGADEPEEPAAADKPPSKAAPAPSAPPKPKPRSGDQPDDRLEKSKTRETAPGAKDLPMGDL